ncbi:hypothetical protein GWK47_034638 [Chionoecetes opilio]|uniref:Uncharacterized protein n=1 Tax=Chionoecetes opilio TaxID=41210 RepID=A0A8J5D2U4_CHIOP|nr:hypothetical protein GWK47_034638 [Chionoecetes opilio]
MCGVGRAMKQLSGSGWGSGRLAVGRWVHTSSQQYSSEESDLQIQKVERLEKSEAAKEVLDFWTRARIPTIAETSVRRKITGLFDEWKILSKSKNNSGVTPAEKQKTFQESLPDLLDIAHSDALTLMTIPEDKEFLLAQRAKGRRGSMAGLDKKLKESVCRRESSLSRSRQQTPKGEEMVELESSSSESSSPANAPKHIDFFFRRRGRFSTKAIEDTGHEVRPIP